jgi:hypothetical protein
MKRRQWELDLSYGEVAERARRYGWANCTAKKVWQIENQNRELRSRAELVALARALETTADALTTGLGDEGEPVSLAGVPAVGHLELTEDEKQKVRDRFQ